MKKLGFVIATAIAALSIGALPVSAYPPSTPPTTASIGGSGELPPTTASIGGSGELPATGSDSAPTVQIAGGLVAMGAGLAVVAGVRRRKPSSI